MAKVIDLKGQKFGRLTVIKRVESAKQYKSKWLCTCECGNETSVQSYSLRSGNTKSCGCLQKEIVAEQSTIHGNSKRGKMSPEYLSWSNMHTRCKNKNSPSYCSYGKRGISVYKKWNKFENFLADMGEKPSPEHSLERKENDGNYEPNNCKWATVEEQARNKRLYANNKSGHRGISRIKKNGKWQATIGVKGKSIYLGEYTDIQDAINAKIKAEKLYWKSS